MKFFLGFVISSVFISTAFAAESLTPEQTKALATQTETLKKLGTDPVVVAAVKAVNTSALAD